MLQGDTRNLPLQNIFQTLGLNQQAGMLTITFQDMERCLAIRDTGILLLCERPHESLLLQQILARLKVLTPAEYQNVFSTVTNKAPPGEVLLDRHLLDEGQVYGPVREQILERLYEIFEWRGARYKFEVKPVPEERMLFHRTELVQALEFPVHSVLMEVAHREDEWRRIREVIPGPHQIYRITSSLEQLESFGCPEYLDQERFWQLIKLFDGQRVLDQILEESPLPAFFVFNTLRLLIECGQASVVDLEEKKALAEGLQGRYRVAEVTCIYLSILGDDPGDLEVRKKLVLLLERQKAPGEQLVPHYRRLAAAARSEADLPQYRQYLSKILHFEPKDIEALEELSRLLLELKKEREFRPILSRYVEAILKARDFDRGVEFLIFLGTLRPKDAELIKERAYLYQIANRKSDAALCYQQAAKVYAESKDRKNLRVTVDRLRLLDAKAASRWRKILYDLELKRPRRTGALKRIALTTLLLPPILIGAIYEWNARYAYAKAFENSKRLAGLGDLARASRGLEKFRKKYPWSVVSHKIPQDQRKLDGIWKEYQEEIDSSQATPPRPKPLPDESIEYALTRAISLRKNKQYVEALHLLRSLSSKRLPPALVKSVEGEIQFLSKYLDGARKFYDQATAAESKHNLEEALRLYQIVAENYPDSSQAKNLQFPLLVEVLPPHARLSMDGKEVPGPPFQLRIPATGEILLIAECDTFEKHTEWVSPGLRWRVQIRLHKRPTWAKSLNAPIETQPLHMGNSLFVGTRSGKVVALSTTEG
ncbi:MAG: DUF4388 domain-containing protein, partial [Planctomycetota bacterium]